MKGVNVGLCAIVLFLCGAFNVNATPHLLGANKCTWGPSYWCHDFSNAKDCNAVKHCIQTVWEKQQVPVDDDSICKICKDMVTQARDQLRSNETMEELKEVFEGSCNLIPIKLIKKECSKLANDFIPELVEALSSQMNPDQVCSVAGLCNNVEIDKILMSTYAAVLDGTLTEEPESEEVTTPAAPKSTQRALSCGNCNQLSNMIVNKFQSTNRDDMLENMLDICGEMSSFSDACANIVIVYFNDIYKHMTQHLNADGICHLSGVCAYKYHQHKEDVVPTEMLIPLNGNDDIPCELCEQLVHHLRDLLVANTTESEFKQVLEGLCKQTKSFTDECLSIVDQYYHVIYDALVNKLDANGACFIIGVCPKGVESSNGPIMPLLPVLPPAKISVTVKKISSSKKKHLGESEPKFTQEELLGMTLPIDHLMGAANPNALVNGGEFCTICEYLLHFIQETLATPATEDEIKNCVNTVCNKFPTGVRGQCHNFVDMYGDAIIALLIQELDPRQVCPLMAMCPKNVEKHDDIEVFNPTPVEGQSDKPTCPLCLFAVEQAQEKIKNDKSKTHIRQVLDNLCSHLPNKLQAECVDFVETYSNELIDMLITDFKPQEICVELRLCTQSKYYLDELGISLEDHPFESYEHIIDNSAFNEIDEDDDVPIQIAFSQDLSTASPNCLLCEEVIKIAERRVNKHTTKDDIKNALAHACTKFKKNIQFKCHKYVDKYGDKIAALLLEELDPKIICREIGLCISGEQEDLEIDEAFKYDVIALPKDSKLGRLTNNKATVKDPPTCVLCEFIMTKLEIELKNKTEQEEIKQVIETICDRLPKTIAKSCDSFVDQYANAIIALIGSVPPKELCKKLQLCFSGLSTFTDEVIECGVCHGASKALLPFFRVHKDYDELSVQDMISVACENLPAKYYTICSEIISIYGISIKHLSEKPYIDESHVCSEIGKCFESEKSNLAFARISA